LNIADWAVEQQDAKGGWPEYKEILKNYACVYSAMSQGQALSILVRAFSATHNAVYLDSASKAVKLMLEDVSRGGTSRRGNDGIILEEFVHEKPNTVLNGWIFALFGLYDYTLARNEEYAKAALQDSLMALKNSIAGYSAGFWSFYDTDKNLSSPFYHRLHIAQLMSVEKAFSDNTGEFVRIRVLFEKQYSDFLNRCRAVAVKVFQKILNPPDVILK